MHLQLQCIFLKLCIATDEIKEKKRSDVCTLERRVFTCYTSRCVNQLCTAASVSKWHVVHPRLMQIIIKKIHGEGQTEYVRALQH